jgi:hypothetical protein
MTSLMERERILGNIDEACRNGAARYRACRIAGISLNCWYRWQQDRTVVPAMAAQRFRHHRAGAAMGTAIHSLV